MGEVRQHHRPFLFTMGEVLGGQNRMTTYRISPLSLCGENLLSFTLNFFSATTAAARLFRKMATSSPILAMQLHNSQSGEYIADCRRVCVNSAPRSPLLAVFCEFSHAKFAN